MNSDLATGLLRLITAYYGLLRLITAYYGLLRLITANLP
jgi:hypothetical protein